MNAQLLDDYMAWEVGATIKQMSPLKAPRLNSMPSLLYQNYWQLVGNDATQSILNFLNTTTLPSHLNHTYVTLIPKVKNLTTLGIAITLKLISNVLRVLQVEKLDYPGSLVLSSFSRDALASCLCECPSTLGGTLSMVTRDFAQNPRTLNMIMTFIRTLQSHYNTIIETRARFLYSLLKVYP